MLIRAATLFFIFIGFANAELLVEKNPNADISYFIGKGEDSKVAEKINAILHIGPLHEITSIPPEANDNDASKSSYSNEVIRNDAKVVLVKVVTEGCAASCWTNNDHYNFDAKTGEYIHVSSLFTQAGMAHVSSRLIKKWTQQIREDAKAYASGDSWADGCIENGINTCLDGLADECIGRMKTNYDKGTPYMGYDFEMGPKGVTFVGAYCTKTMSSYPASLSYQEMFSYLSEYGKSLFSKNATINQPMHPFNQIFSGTIGGKYPIKMFLFEPYPSAGYLQGYYLYTKHNKPINITGFYENNTLLIQEKDEKDQNTGATITAQPTKNGFDGYWEGNNKKLKFSVVVSYP
jgi:hypothetical protein